MAGTAGAENNKDAIFSLLATHLCLHNCSWVDCDDRTIPRVLFVYMQIINKGNYTYYSTFVGNTFIWSRKSMITWYGYRGLRVFIFHLKTTSHRWHDHRVYVY